MMVTITWVNGLKRLQKMLGDKKKNKECWSAQPIKLELIGSFNRDKGSVEAFMGKQEENIIHGISSDAKNITLINCQKINDIFNKSNSYIILHKN